MLPIDDPTTGAAMIEGYLLLDSCADTAFELGDAAAVSCIPAALTNAHQLMPRLVDIKTLAPAHREELSEMLREQAAGRQALAVCAWITADVSIEDLAEHLAQFMYGPGPGGAMLHWRYFDPRVFAATLAVCSDAQRVALLGPVGHWRFTWCRHWWLACGSADKVDQLCAYDSAWPSPAQWSIILHAPVLHRVLTQLGEDGAGSAQRCLRQQASAIAYLADGLSTLHLENEDDLVEFVHLCTRYGAAYRQHPRLKAGWRALAEGSFSWTALRFHLDEADFERLETSLRQAEAIR